ncbi:MAG: N-acetylneuraminate synthase family protein [Nitrospirae bacterium]|nr:N-acetylneuraminate synthase family protein [Nitrospirota bacterium]MBI4839382.1 N-acetylneuraminate synthase family protein [Nitrospirota bacterium]
MDKMMISKKAVGAGEPVLIIAEAGINHDGDIKRAHDLIDVAADAGADVIKFQTHLADKEMLNVSDTAVYLNESLFNLIKRMELTLDQHFELKEHAVKKGLIFLSTPFSKEAVDLLEKVGVDAYKIGSGELTNMPFLEYAASKKKPMIISTGMSTVNEAETTVNMLKSKGIPLMIMQCTSQYPAEYKNVFLKTISEYKDRFKIPVGFSDHSQGNYMAFAAVTLGACAVEKHFTASRKWPGPDQQSSIEPDELADLVKGIRAIENGLKGSKTLTEGEKGLQQLFRESVVSLKNIPAETVITKGAVWVKRPGSGIPASELNKVIGKKAKKNISADQTLSWEDVY